MREEPKVNWNIEQDYNDTVNSMIASMCLMAYDVYDKEIQSPYIDQRTAIARAIGDAIKKHISIVQIDCTLDRQIPQRIIEDKEFVEHEMKRTFMLMANEIYESNHWRVKRTGFPVQTSFRFSMGVLKLKDTL